MELHTVVVNGGQLFRIALEGNDAKNSQTNSMISAQILIQTHVINGLSGGRAVPGFLDDHCPDAVEVIFCYTMVRWDHVLFLKPSLST